jgi:hypothetical protein
MGDYFTKIIPSLLEVDDVERKTDTALAWLIEKNIIKPVKTDCVLGLGYPPNIGIKNIFDVEPSQNNLASYLQLATNGLEIVTERTVFDAGQAGLDVVECPVCYENIIEGEWGEFLSDWVENGNGIMACDCCRQQSAINSYRFIAGNTQWGFSNFGLIFWNLPNPSISRAFLKEMEIIVGSEVMLIAGKL